MQCVVPPSRDAVFVFFFFQAEDGIRDVAVTGVQTCALPILSGQANITSWVNRVPGVPIRTSTSCSAYNPNDPTSRYLTIGAFSTPAPWTFEIGRASCRERV